MDVADLIVEWCEEKKFDVKSCYFGIHTSYIDINGFLFRIHSKSVSYLTPVNSMGSQRVNVCNVEDPNFFKEIEEIISKYGLSSS